MSVLAIIKAQIKICGRQLPGSPRGSAQLPSEGDDHLDRGLRLRSIHVLYVRVYVRIAACVRAASCVLRAYVYVLHVNRAFKAR